MRQDLPEEGNAYREGKQNTQIKAKCYSRDQQQVSLGYKQIKLNIKHRIPEFQLYTKIFNTRHNNIEQYTLPLQD